MKMCLVPVLVIAAAGSFASADDAGRVLRSAAAIDAAEVLSLEPLRSVMFASDQAAAARQGEDAVAAASDDGNSTELAKKLSNPVANLISVPFQFNYDSGLSYTWKTATTVGLNTESTYDWTHDQWTVPVNATVGQFVKIGRLPVQFTVGTRYYVEGPSGAPEWGARFVMTFLFPK